jgi:hypothetical protein
MKPVVIGLIGPKECGKSTTVEIIKSMIDANEKAFADKLKNACCAAFKIERNHFDDQNLKEVDFPTPKKLTIDNVREILQFFNVNYESCIKNPYSLAGKDLTSPRHIAQFIGTDLLRDCVRDTIHIDSVEIEKDKVTIISDTRFENEFTTMIVRSDITYIPIYIYRKRAEDKARKSEVRSENDFFKFKDDAIQLDNNGTLEDLRSGIYNILSKFYKG